MAEDVLTALKEAKDDRDCETKLVLLLTFDRFDLIRKFRKSRLEVRLTLLPSCLVIQCLKPTCKQSLLSVYAVGEQCV
jgi:hypothetical protein